MEQLAYYLQIGTTSSSVVFAFVFIFYNWNKSLFKKLLAVQFVVFSYGLFINFIAFNDFFHLFPHLSRTGLLCAFIIPPLQFLAIQWCIKPRSLKWVDSLHFLPALLYVINFYDYFILSADEKIYLLYNNSIAKFSEGFLPSYFLPLLSLLQTTIYLVWFGLMTRRLQKEIASKSLLHFLYFIMGFMVFHYLPTVMVLLYYYDAHAFTSWLPIIYAVSNLVFFFKILSTPEWLFYNKPESAEDFVAEESRLSTKLDNHSSALELALIARLSPNKAALNEEELALFDQITKTIEGDRFFLDPMFSQKELADKLTVSEYKIRTLFEKVYQMKFTDYTNHRRIYFLLHEMRNKPQWQNFSFAAIARKLGYLSANSFYLNFKKIAGVTPKDYFNKVDE